MMIIRYYIATVLTHEPQFWGSSGHTDHGVQQTSGGLLYLGSRFGPALGVY